MQKKLLFIPTLFVILLLSFLVDIPIAVYLNKIASKNPADFIIFWKSTVPAIVLIIILWIYFYWKKKHTYIPYFWMGPLVGDILAHLFKITTMRPRPYELLPIEPLGKLASMSFPSGHMAFLAGILAILELKKIREEKVGNIIYYLWIIMLLLTGFNRLYMGVHYLSDVIAGFLLGYAVGMYLVWFEGSYHWSKKKFFQNFWIPICISLALIIPLLAYVEKII